MPDPIQATVIRAWDDIVITAYWDRPSIEGQPPWLVIRQMRYHDSGPPTDKTIRISADEARGLADLILKGLRG